ncbi:MAG: hypothetical protein AB1750_10465 [Chloroflexota bacterium]
MINSSLIFSYAICRLSFGFNSDMPILNLSTDAVTFLFTDIEGGAKLAKVLEGYALPAEAPATY